jgi:hypothetical protein
MAVRYFPGAAAPGRFIYRPLELTDRPNEASLAVWMFVLGSDAAAPACAAIHQRVGGAGTVRGPWDLAAIQDDTLSS